MKDMGIRDRINPNSGKIQYHAGQILGHLEKDLPVDCYCLIGLMMSDIYPSEDWNFGLILN